MAHSTLVYSRRARRDKPPPWYLRRTWWQMYTDIHSRTRTSFYTNNMHPRIGCMHARKGQVLVNPSGIPLGFSEEVRDVFLTDMAILSRVNGRFAWVLWAIHNTWLGKCVSKYIYCMLFILLDQTLISSDFFEKSVTFI